MDIKKNLLWMIQAGITEFSTDAPSVVVPKDDTPTTILANSEALQATNLDELNAKKAHFTECPLYKTASHTLCGKGIPFAKLMCIVTCPNADSDKSGISFSGDSGSLLSRMLKAIHLDMETQTYCTYLSPWRAPGNRKLTDSEIATLKPFLDQEIKLVQPQLMLLFGSELSSALLSVNTLSKARHTWHSYLDIPTRVSLPLDTINTTARRQQAWEDLQEVQKKLNQ